MLISKNPHPSIEDFASLMNNTKAFLNADARNNPHYYRNRGGLLLEDDVESALLECAKGTPFENTIVKVSGHRFPDIIAGKLYGVEVKSTKSNHWTSTGSSILESTRIEDVQRIFMLFGKLGGNPIEFLSKPYEQCLDDIAVTHMPRYRINMMLNSGETIFDKMNISYDELRLMENPVPAVARYYRSQLKEGESLWWTGDKSDEAVSPKVRMWRTLSKVEKDKYAAYGLAKYPEVVAGKYDRFSLWLSSQGVVNPNVRDQFSAGGQVSIQGIESMLPAVFRRIKEYADMIICYLHDQHDDVGELPNDYDYNSDSVLTQWCNSVAELYEHQDNEIIRRSLRSIFSQTSPANE